MVKVKKKGERIIAQNKKAAFDYFFEETLEAGISLEGSEVKSVKLGNISLRDSFCHLDDGELYVKNMYIAQYSKTGSFAPDERRSRKLLIHKRELKKLIGRMREKGYTVVPVKLYFKGRYAKLQIALARGKKQYDKRQTIKDRDIARQAERELARINTKYNG